jgi:hypothetical protein
MAMASWREQESGTQACSREDNESRAHASGPGDAEMGCFRCECVDQGCTCAIRLTVAERSAMKGVAEMVPIEHQTLDRVVRIVVFGVPPAALVAAGWLAWGGILHWQDLAVLAITYTLSGLGTNSLCHYYGANRPNARATRPWPLPRRQ